MFACSPHVSVSNHPEQANEVSASKDESFYRDKIAEVAELAYAQVSEACAARLEGSTPSFRNIFYESTIYSMAAKQLIGNF